MGQGYVATPAEVIKYSKLYAAGVLNGIVEVLQNNPEVDPIEVLQHVSASELKASGHE